MRKLTRPNPPACLSRFRHGKNQWRELTPNHRTEIWEQLKIMQGSFCAYCERRIDLESPNKHIEHFFQRNNYPQMTFDWNNLFGSCDDNHTCGSHKDNHAKHINPSHICKPDIDDPNDLLEFLYDGTVRPKQELSAAQKQKAQNTINAFNLMHSSLKGRRREAMKAEKSIVESLYEHAAVDAQPLKDYLSNIEDKEFSSALRSISF